MSTYILLMTLNPEGQARALADPEFLLAVEDEIHVPGVSTLGCYAVLGQYDFVTIVEADDNGAVALFSIEMGVRAGVHVTTLPAVPVAKLDEKAGDQPPGEMAGIELRPESASGG